MDITIDSGHSNGKLFWDFMLDETHFHACANATLMHINDQLEQLFDRGDLEELDYDEGAGILTIITNDEVTFVISKHGPSGQLWLASPISGGLHFDYDAASQDWLLSTGESLKQLLAANLQDSAGLHVVF